MSARTIIAVRSVRRGAIFIPSCPCPPSKSAERKSVGKEKHEACFAVKTYVLGKNPAVHGDRKHFGRNLSRLRSATGLTQEQMAEKSEISVRYVQFIEAGRYAPTVIVAARLRKALDCSWDDLMTGL